MRGLVVVDETGAYESWVDEHPTFAEAMEEARNETGTEPKLVLKQDDAATGARAVTQ